MAANVRVGSTTDLLRHSHLRLLSGVKQTSNVRYSESPALMSAFGVKADALALPSKCLLVSRKRHSRRAKYMDSRLLLG